MSSFSVPVLIKVATDSSVIKASWKVLIGFCQTTLHMSPQTQRHAVTAMFVSSHQHPILQFSCDVRSAEEKLVIWTSCRERGTFLWEVSGINVSGRSPTGRYWKTGRSRMRAMKREPGAVKEEWVLCWESGWWVCDAEGAALNQCYSHWGHFKCFSVEIQFLVSGADVSSVAVNSICSIFSASLTSREIAEGNSVKMVLLLVVVPVVCRCFLTFEKSLCAVMSEHRTCLFSIWMKQWDRSVEFTDHRHHNTCC